MDFTQLSKAVLEEQYLSQAKPRELVWYNKQKKLIAEKFNNEIEPIQIEIFRRKKPRTLGQYCTSKIRLNNKFGCTRSTLLHELTHAYMRKRNCYTKAHVNEFWELLKYLKNGGNVVDFYAREQKQVQRIAACKAEKRSPDYKLQKIRERIRKWSGKLQRAENAIKKLQRQEKNLMKKVI